jgi:putative membrane protein
MVTIAIAMQEWTASGHEQSLIESPFFVFAPWVFAVAVLLLLLRALATLKRYRAVHVLTAADQERVRIAIRGIEDSTSGEIVPLVVERSDPQTHTLLLGAAAFAVIADIALLRFLPSHGLLQLGAAELAVTALGLGFTRLCTDYRRWFLTAARADATAGEQALIELARLTQGQDSTAPLVLVFVSLFEHRVVVLANAPVAGALRKEHWPAAVETVLADVRRGRLADGLVAGINACAKEMQLAFPPGAPHENRFADHAITRRE